MAGVSERAGVLVVRAWVEAGEGPLRARITARLDLVGGEETSVVVGGWEAAAEVVRRWLEEFERGDSIPRAPGDGSVTPA
jgi:hypothetical protein